MTTLVCVCIASALLWINHLTESDAEDIETPGPKLPSVMVTLALMDLIYDNSFVPEKLENMPRCLKWIYEVVLSVFMLDVCLHFWKATEYILYLLLKIIVLWMGFVSHMTYIEYEYYCQAVMTLPLAFLILSFAGHATDHFHLVRGKYLGIKPRAAIQEDGIPRLGDQQHERLPSSPTMPQQPPEGGRKVRQPRRKRTTPQAP